MFRINSYLCFSLETGGLIIGWFFAVVCCYLEVACIYEITQIRCSPDLIILMLVFPLMVVLSVTLIIGVKKRDSSLVKPMMIMTGIITAILVLMVHLEFPQIVIPILVFSYNFVALYSLCKKFKNEKETGSRFFNDLIVHSYTVATPGPQENAKEPAPMTQPQKMAEQPPPMYQDVCPSLDHQV